jgi:hypothetical protein
MVRWGRILVMTSTVSAAACSSNVGGQAGPSIDAGSKRSSDAQSTITANDARCPAAWSMDLVNGAICTVKDLLCTYPQGQIKCEPDGTPLKWYAAGESGCPEPSPSLGTPCSVSGGICSYFATGSDTTDSVNYCCDGVTKAWEMEPTTGCPNGNTCGTILASDYDQTCTSAADCAAVSDGDFCTPNRCTNCTTAFVNTGAEALYESDMAKKVSVPALCPCPSGPLPACVQGKCVPAP